MSRPRHARKELEALLKEAEAKGWRVVKGSKYFKMYCPCADSPGIPSDLESFFDRVMEELLRLDTVEDSTISASLAKKTVTIMVTIDAPSPEAAAAIGMSAIRAAFHAAGAATLDWPLFDELSIGAGELIGA